MCRTLIVTLLIVAGPPCVLAQGGEQMLFQLDEKLNGGVRTVRVYRSGGRGGAERRLSQEDFYDRQGRKTEEVRYGGDGKVTAKRVLSYDAVGRLEEAAEYAAGGALIIKKRYAYAAGKVEEVTYGSDGSPRPGRTVNSFDEEGRLVSTETVGGEPPSLKVVAAYRDGGKTVEVTMCAGDPAAGMIAPGKSGPVVLSDAAAARMKGVGPCGGGYLTSRTVFMLDERGLITDVAIYTHDNTLISRERQAREFDARGNWVKETRSRWNAEIDSFEPFEVRERVITYY